jgi:integral membrane protein (TIGR01906 family)
MKGQFEAIGRIVMQCLVLVAVPLACLAGPVRFLALRPEFYRWGQNRYVVLTEPSPREQAAADLALVRFFSENVDSLQTQLIKVGLSSEFFTERERIHLEDVHQLLQVVGFLAALGLAIIIAGLILGIFGLLGIRLSTQVKAIRLGSIATFIIMVFFGAAALLDFQSLFLEFHLLSFSNDLWQLDPARHNLIRIFPFGFFMDAALVDALLTGVCAVILGAAATWLLRRRWIGPR